MCGRYAIAPTRADAWAPVRDTLGEHIERELAGLKARYNVAPSTQVPVIVQDAATRQIHAVAARWGFVPHWWREPSFPKFSTINARVEDLRAKPTWRDAFTVTRCLVPATHWYEWQRVTGGKVPHALSMAEERGFMFAGLYSRWKMTPDTEPIHTAAILTRPAAPGIAHLHDRMPVILHPAGWRYWLDPLERNPSALAAFLEENTIVQTRFWKVAVLVNKPENDAPECLAPDGPLGPASFP